MINQDFIHSLYQEHPSEKREIELILCHFLNINTASLMIYDTPISKELQKVILKAIQNRLDGLPLAYITGTKGFWTLDLMVNQHTLIPRPETEQLVELILNWTDQKFSGSILDLGTGTGAIALSIAKERPEANITAIDFSMECIKVAKINCENYKLKNVKIFQSHWFSELNDQKFDYIIANPPYVAENDNHLDDLKHEPITALTAKNNGLADLQQIIQQAPQYLKPSARLMLEHGYNQRDVLHDLFKESCYNNVKTYNDLSGIPRITTALH